MAITKIKSLGITDGTIATSNIAADAVDGTKIADNAINTEHYTNGSIGTVKLTDNVITTAKLNSSAVTTAKLADDAVTTAKVNPAQTDISSVGSLSSLAVTHGTNTASVATFINTGDNATNEGVVHVKQSTATNKPTMVIEQTGEGGNPGDKQGLLIKGAGQNQGDGLLLGVETSNSNIASGNIIRPFSVWNGGYVAVENKNNETSFQIDKEGLVQEVQIPASQNSMNINGMNQTISNSANYVVTGLTSAYYNSNSLNNSGYFDSTTSKFTAPSGALSCHYFVHFQTLLGITLPTSSVDHYGYIGIRMNGVNGAGIPFASYRQVTQGESSSTISWETMSVSGVVRLDATDYIEPIFTGTNNVSIRIHSGTYTSFSVIKIG